MPNFVSNCEKCILATHSLNISPCVAPPCHTVCVSIFIENCDRVRVRVHRHGKDTYMVEWGWPYTN